MLSNKIVDAHNGNLDALHALILELNDTPTSKLYRLLCTSLRPLHTRFLLFLTDIVLQDCREIVVKALSDVLADMGIVLKDANFLLHLLYRNNMELMQHVMRHHFVTRSIPYYQHHTMITAIVSKSVDTQLAALVARKFGLLQPLALHLRRAVKQHDLNRCLHLIRVGAPLDPSSYILAAARGHVDICELYIDAGFQDVRAHDNKALRVAAGRGHIIVCKHIIHVALPRTATPTQSVVQDIRARDNEALRWAAGHGHLDVCRLLWSCGLTPVDLRADNNNALRWAAGKGHRNVCEFLLSSGLSLDDVRANDNEALRMSIRHEHVDVATFLLEFLTLSDIRICNNYALRWASGLGYADICEALIARGLTLDDIRANDNEAFRRAAGYGCLRVCKLLWNTGLTLDDIRVLDNEAFRMAASHGHLAVCKWLIQCGLTPEDAAARDGEALSVATKKGFEDVCAFLLSLNLLGTLPTVKRVVTFNFVPTMSFTNDSVV